MTTHQHRHTRRIWVLLLALSAILSTSSAIANEKAIHVPVQFNGQHTSQLDDLVTITLDAMASSQWLKAQRTAEQLSKQFPDYALGHFLLAEAHQTASRSALLMDSSKLTLKTLDLLLEARSRAELIGAAKQRLEHNVSESTHTLHPAEIIQIGSHIDNVVYVDLRSSTLYLFDTTGPASRLIKRFYISSGRGGYGKTVEGDLKTPLGVYRINGFRNDDSLPPLYGAGALMLNYPNKLDRSFGRTGSGIWLHGNPRSNRSRSPHSSEGCVTMANDHLLDLHQLLNHRRTHVILASRSSWMSLEQQHALRERYQELFNQYRSAWLNNSVKDLMTIYSPDALPVHIQHANMATAKRVSSSSMQTKLAPDGLSLDALESVSPGSVSLLFNPDTGSSYTHLVMEFEAGGQNPLRMTLYWQRDSQGYWQIKREEIDVSDV